MNWTKSISKILFLLSIAFLANKYAYSQIAEIESKIPKNVPIKIELKNQDSVDWVHDLEIIVTNTGKKPIYFLFLSLVLDVKAEDGNFRGFSLLYGNKNLYSTEGLAEENDSSIQPNKTYTFKINKNSADAWTYRNAQENFVQPRTAQLKLGWLSFGDGSGIKGGGTIYVKKQ